MGASFAIHKKTKTMKLLTEYSKNKYNFKIFHRDGILAIAKGIGQFSGAENWEVIKISSHNGLTMGGVYMPPAEFGPSNEQFGIKGWFAFNEQDAWRIFNKQKNKIEQ